MKKIFRMALVFALAGATLMYTGCTKDYGEEIDNLDSKISSLESSLSQRLGDLQTEVSNLRSSVTSLESAYKAADELIKGDVSDLKNRVGTLENQIKELSKYATKDELKEAREALEKKITDDVAALKADILKVTDDLAKEIADLKDELKKKADAEDVDKKIEDLNKALEELDAVYGFLSDELRSIVFLPDFYFAGIEATSYDFGSFIGYLVYGNPYADYSFYSNENATGWSDSSSETYPIKYTFPRGAKYMYDLYYDTDAKGLAKWYKYDPETYEWIYKDGKLVQGKEGDANVRRYFPANHLDGQIGIAKYNLNPSSFPTDSATWSLNGRNVKYVLKGEEEVTWAPVFKGITNNNGVASVEFDIENPELIYSSILGSVLDAAIGLYKQYEYGYLDIEGIYETFFRDNRLQANTNQNWMEQAQHELLAKSFRYNNIPTMQLVGTLNDGREIVSDWHAISSSEEVVDHLAFLSDNDYVTDWYDCGINDYEVEKDLYTNSRWAAIDPASVPVKWNSGGLDLSELIAIHTVDMMSWEAVAEYSIDEFSAKYPGYHFEFELLPYKIGGNSTSEDMYGALDGSWFTPCYVESVAGKPVSHKIPKDSEDGISAVGRMPVVLVTLVDDDKNIYAFGWFKLIISKDAKPDQFLVIPDLGKVPFICRNYTLKTTWDQFSYFVLEKLKVDKELFDKTYTYDGIYVYRTVKDGSSSKKELYRAVAPGGGVNVVFQNWNGKEYKEVNYGQAAYNIDLDGTGVNDAFQWNVNPQAIGAGKSNSIYFKFHNGENVVYFEMKAEVAPKAKFNWVANKIDNLWFTDINSDPKNTVRISVPVPVVNPTVPNVMDFQKDLNTFFTQNKPALILDQDNDPIYTSIYNNWMSPYYGELHTFKTTFQFSAEQPVIVDDEGNPWALFTKTWKGGTSTNEDYTKLYCTMYYYNAWGQRLPEQDELNDANYTKVPKIYTDGSNLVATIIKDGDQQIIKYANTTIAKYLLNLWSYKKTDQAEMLFANITTKNKYGSTACVSVDDGQFYVRFIRPIDVDFAAQDVAEESQVDGANVKVINFFDGITDWNNQKVIVKNMVQKKDHEDKPVYDADGNPVMVWDGTYSENVIKTLNIYKYYGFKKLRIDIGQALRNNWNSQAADPSNSWGVMAVETPAHILRLGTVNASGVFVETTLTPTISPATSGQHKIYSVDITNFNDMKEFVLNYRNTQGYAETFTILVPVEIDYSWGTLSDFMVINIKETGQTQGQ